MSHRLAATVGKTAAAFAFSAGALCANADTLWSEINPRPDAIDRAAVRVDPSVNPVNVPTNLGTLDEKFTTPNGNSPSALPRKFGALSSLYNYGDANRMLQLTGLQNSSQALHVFMVAKGAAKSTGWGGYLALAGGERFNFQDAGGNGIAVYLPGNKSQTLKSSINTGDFRAVMEYKIARASDSEITASGAFHTADATSRTTPLTAACTALNHTTLRLGVRHDNTAANFHMGEFLLFTGDAVPSDTEAEAIAVYLRNKWLGVPLSGVITIPAGETGHINGVSQLTCGASTVFDVAEGATLFIDCPIVDGAAPSTFVKRGAGTLVLTRACPDLSGQIVVEAGKLELRGDGALPNAKVNGTLTLADGTAATFTAAATPLPAALKKAVVWVDPSVTTARIPENLGTARGSFEPNRSGKPGPTRENPVFGTLPAWLFNHDWDAAIKFTGLQNSSQSLRVFMVAKGKETTKWGGYLGFNGGERFNFQDAEGNGIAVYLPDGKSQKITTAATASFKAILEYKIARSTDAEVSASGAFHVVDNTTGTTPLTLACSALNHTTLRLGDRGSDGCARFYLGEFLLFTGNDTITDSEANEVVAYLRKKWLGATELVGDDRDPAPTVLAVEAGDTATLNGSAAPGLVKTGAGTLKVSGAVSALTVNAGAVEFADNATSVGALTLADGAGLVYNGVAGTAGTLTVPADATVTVAVGAAVDRHLEEQTILSFTSGTIAGAFTLSEEAAKRWSVKVIGNEVKLLKNSGMIIIVR